MQAQLKAEIRRAAKALDDAVEVGDADAVLACFAEDGEIELFGITKRGRAEIKQAIDWMFKTLGKIQFIPLAIMVEGDLFFEEFVLIAQPEGDKTLRLKASEVLVYEDYKVKSLRLYFDRLAMARFLAKGGLEKMAISWLDRVSLRGLAGPPG